MKANIKCKKCGGEQFEAPTRPNNSTKVTCSKCGAVDTYGNVVKAFNDQVVKDLKGKLGKLFK